MNKSKTAAAPHACKLITAMVSVALLSLSAQSRELGELDVLSRAPMKQLNGPDAIAKARAATPAANIERAHFEERLALPTFTWLQQAVKAKTASAAALASSTPERAAREQLKQLADLYRVSPSEIDAAPLHHVQQLENGGYLVKFTNSHEGVEIFRESATVLLKSNKEAAAVGGFISGTGASASRAANGFASTTKLSAEQAVAVALKDYGFTADVANALRAPAAVASAKAAGNSSVYRFLDLPRTNRSADGTYLSEPARIKDVWFRLPDGLVRAYYIEVQTVESKPIRSNYYSYVVSADDGQVLFRHNLTSDLAAKPQENASAPQTAAAAETTYSYRVYAESSGSFLPLPSPIGRTTFPHPSGKPDGVYAAFVPSNLITIQNYPYSKNDPWLSSTATTTKGNNVEAYTDLFNPDGIGTPDAAECNLSATPATDFHACLNGVKSFDYTFDTSKAPNVSRAQSMASVTNMFFMNNYLHDWYYDAGFDEAAGNAQSNNYGRGGEEGDSIKAEAQDNSGMNNANMSTPSDGGRPKMQMYMYTGPTTSGLTITKPASVTGTYTTNTASFGASKFSITNGIVVADPIDGCGTDPFNNAGLMAGKIAYIDRGTCTFVEKAKNAQSAGAVGVIIGNNRDATVAPGMSGTDASVTIGVLSISQNDATKLKAAAQGLTGKIELATGVNRDGTLDNSTIAHEWGHYISNRLVGNANGLSTNLSNGMGEGWADFHALLLLVKESDQAQANNANFAGAYPMGGYTEPGVIGEYAGIRRYPYSRDLGKNPLTLKHIESDVALPTTPAPAFGASGASNAEVHSTGEVWASMLWQCYSNLLNDSGRLSFTEAQNRMKRYLVAGYKLTPNAPTIIEARDALLAAIKSQDERDFALCYQAFATRGAGAGAIIPDRYSKTNAGVVESFASAGVAFVSATLSDIARYCDTDGVLDNGETATLTVTVRNTGSTALASTVANITSTNPHISFPAGATVSLPASSVGQTVSATLQVRLTGAVGREAADFTIALSDPAVSYTPVPGKVSFAVNYDQAANRSATDDVNSSHSVWTVNSDVTGTARASSFATRIANTTLDGRWFIPSLTGVVQTWLISPALNVANAGNFSFSFKHRFGFEADATTKYDGGILEISTDDGASWSQIPGSALVNGYNGKISEASNPRTGVDAFVGDSAAWPALESVTVNLGTAYAGKTVKVRFLAAADPAGTSNGWEIDDIAFSNITNKPFDAVTSDAQQCAVVSLSAGTPQQGTLNAAFGTPLRTRLLGADSAPVASASVLFQAPTSGASGTFAGGLSSASVLTDAVGYATAPTFTANGIAGDYKVTASTGSSSVDFLLSNVATQTLSFTNPGTQALGAQTVTLNAVASSGLPVSYSTSTPTVCQVAGNVVTLLAAGTCSITASQAGSGGIPAVSTTQSFTVTADTGPSSGTFTVSAGALGVLNGVGAVTLQTGSSLTLATGTAAAGSTVNLPLGNASLLVQGKTLTVAGTSASTQLAMALGDLNGQSNALPQLKSGSLTLSAPANAAALVVGGSASAKGTVLMSGASGAGLTASLLANGSTKIAVSSGSVVLPCGGARCVAGQTQLTVLAGETLLIDKTGSTSSLTLASAAGGAAGDALSVPTLPAGVSLAGSYANLNGNVVRLGGNSLLSSVQSGLQTYLGAAVTAGSNSALGAAQFLTAGSKLTLAAQTPVLVDPSVADGVSVLPNGQLQIADKGVLTRLSPSLYDLAGLVQLLKAADPAMTLQISTDGRLLATVGGNRFSVMPARGISAGGAAGFGNTPAGALTYTSSQGEQQLLSPVFANFDRLAAILTRIDAGFKSQTQADNSVIGTLQGSTFKLIPGFVVVSIPAAHIADDFWVEGDTVYINNGDGTAQGLQLR